MKKNIVLSSVCALLCIQMFSSCTKEPLDNLNDQEAQIYITHRDSTVNFGAYKTFVIVDSVAVISNNRLAQKSTSAIDQAYLSAVTAQLQQRGYTLSTSNTADLAVNVSRIYNTSTGIIDYSDYYGYYGGYWDPYYWGYGGYGYYFPPVAYYGTYQITEGALSVDILDLKNASASKQIRGIWNGLVRGGNVFQSSNNAALQIQALFQQSPYLQSQR